MQKGYCPLAASTGFYGRRPGHVTKGDRVDRQATSPPLFPQTQETVAVGLQKGWFFRGIWPTCGKFHVLKLYNILINVASFQK